MTLTLGAGVAAASDSSLLPCQILPELFTMTD